MAFRIFCSGMGGFHYRRARVAHDDVIDAGSDMADLVGRVGPNVGGVSDEYAAGVTLMAGVQSRYRLAQSVDLLLAVSGYSRHTYAVHHRNTILPDHSLGTTLYLNPPRPQARREYIEDLVDYLRRADACTWGVVGQIATALGNYSLRSRADRGGHPANMLCQITYD